jgi:hypothetical protein
VRVLRLQWVLVAVKVREYGKKTGEMNSPVFSDLDFIVKPLAGSEFSVRCFATFSKNPRKIPCRVQGGASALCIAAANECSLSSTNYPRF